VTAAAAAGENRPASEANFEIPAGRTLRADRNEELLMGKHF